MTKNAILLRRRNKIFVQKGTAVLPEAYLATALTNLSDLGYTFTEELMETVKTLSEDEFVSLYKSIVKSVKVNLGANFSYYPMYANFPESVMDASETELFINAIIHYLGGGLPSEEVKERFPLLDKKPLKQIGLATEEAFEEMIRQLIGANTSISETDKKDVEWAINQYADVQVLLPEEIPSKENIGFVVAALLKAEKAELEDITRYFKTATDVLRLATALSDGDVSLATNTVFKKFKRPERRLLLGLLQQCSAITEDMLRYKKRWIRLGEILHPNEYKTKFAKVKEAFDILRNDKPFATFNGKMEKALADKDVITSVQLLKTRPGEFARKLDHLLRLTEEPAVVIDAFAEVATDVSTPVLLQVMAHFKHRNEENKARSFFPKGNVAKVFTLENTLTAISSDATTHLVELCKQTLIKRFSVLPALGNVYVDDLLNDYLVPFSQRSASKALRTIVRGSKVDLPEGDTIRFFLWWKEGKMDRGHTGRVDIDLSAVMYDENFNHLEHITYYNLRSAKYKAAHSGDITEAPDGASEFIDFDIPSVLENGGRYVVMSLNSFTSHGFVELPECFAGWMGRQHPGSGEIYEPSTVEDKIDLTSDTQICIPVILDLLERKVIWTDISLTRHPNYYNNVDGNENGMVAIGRALTTLVKPNLYELFQLHAEARGTIVEDKSEAETVFSVKEGTTPFDGELIMAEYLA